MFEDLRAQDRVEGCISEWECLCIAVDTDIDMYSMDDITRLRQIAALLDDGLNLAGIAMVLRLEADNARLRREISDERDRRRRK